MTASRQPGHSPEDISAQATVMRPFPFVELVELLEFNRLRLDAPQTDTTAGNGDPIVGTQDWLLGGADSAADNCDVFVCSTVGALQHALFPPEDTQLRIDMSTENRLQVRAVQPATQRSDDDSTWLRVDIHALIRRVLVPATAPAHLYDLIKHIVVARLWVDVARLPTAGLVQQARVAHPA